jgi:hypothetical protein
MKQSWELPIQEKEKRDNQVMVLERMDRLPLLRSAARLINLYVSKRRGLSSSSCTATCLNEPCVIVCHEVSILFGG